MARSKSMRPMWAASNRACADAAQSASSSSLWPSRHCRPRASAVYPLGRVDDVSGASPLCLGRSRTPQRCARAAGRVTTTCLNKGYSHHAINVSARGDRAHVSMSAVHCVAFVLKRWLLGAHQGSITAKYLDAYLNQFAFRFNRPPLPTPRSARFAAHRICRGHRPDPVQTFALQLPGTKPQHLAATVVRQLPLTDKWLGFLASDQAGEVEGRLRRVDGVYRSSCFRLSHCPTNQATLSAGMERILTSGT